MFSWFLANSFLPVKVMDDSISPMFDYVFSTLHVMIKRNIMT